MGALNTLVVDNGDRVIDSEPTPASEDQRVQRAPLRAQL